MRCFFATTAVDRFVRSFVCSLLAAVATLMPAGAQSAPTIDSVQVGFGGRYKLGYWTPIYLTLSADDHEFRGKIRITTVDGDLMPVTFADGEIAEGESAERDEIVIGAGQTAQFERYAKFGRASQEMIVELIRADSSTPVAHREFRGGDQFRGAPALSELIVVVGGDVGLRPKDHTFVSLGPGELPNRWYGYEGVDAVVVATGQREILGQWSKHSEQLKALDQWVRLGGKLLLSAGANGKEALGPQRPFASMAPGEFHEIRRQTNTSNIESYIRASSPLDQVVSDAEDSAKKAFALPTTILKNFLGRVEVHEGRRPRENPLVVTYSHGMGRAVFVAFDLDAAPVAKWRERPRLTAKLLRGLLPAGRRSTTNRSQEERRIGFNDLSGQLRSALDRFPGTGTIGFTAVAGLVMAYILLIGPADYFLLRKWNRWHWTWWTFPALVLAFIGLTVVWVSGRKEKQVRINQVDVVDIDVRHSVVRGASWAHLLSPDAASYSLTLHPLARGGGDAAGVLFSWQGLPGDGMGGMSSKSRLPAFAHPYSIDAHGSGPSASVRKLPINISSTKSLVGRWWSNQPPTYTARLSPGPHNTLAGEIENPLTVEAESGLLFYRNLAYALPGKLPPGRRIKVDQLPRPRTLEWLLARKRVRNTDEISVPWSRSDVEVPRIVEMMMFHGAVGGRSYTSLQHRYQGYLDWSDHLDDDHAILTLRVNDPAAQILRQQQPLTADAGRHFVVYRVKIPVAEANDAEANNTEANGASTGD